MTFDDAWLYLTMSLTTTISYKIYFKKCDHEKSLTHSLTHSLIHSLTHSLTYWVIENDFAYDFFPETIVDNGFDSPFPFKNDGKFSCWYHDQ